MKKALALFTVVLALGMTAAADAEAKRLGGARNSGMQRQQTTQPANTPPANTANPAGTSAAAPTAGAAAAAAPAAAAKRSWMGPLAGLAAGIGLMALASHLGFGEGLANIMMIALVVMAGLALVGFIMRKRAAGAGPSLAGAGGSAGGTSPNGGRSLLGSGIGSALGASAAQPAAAGAIPADFDVASFVRNAKSQFVALQTAHDAGDLDQLRSYLTPEMYEAAREDLQSRGDATQRTEVFGLEAQVVEVVEEADRYIVSVRFTGSTRDQAGAVPEDLDELWHLTKPRTGYGGWMVAGIQQVRND
ncbi:Tim44 domain-containing protein [Ramlibacter sp. WS9]|uniref:Tim44 domain-containing protein n=1 Tax=Ramlibacter sp. WS9 TaxID=1882741 RepID=UPI001144ADED|nr:TIM44-like domain-containing protein [Ramlibacter sp. WS9]ROZ78818.1 Tim44 domain-containing protein [Ramlibacter sp. WS9]